MKAMLALSSVQDVMEEAAPFWKVPHSCLGQGRKGAFTGHHSCPDLRTELSKEVKVVQRGDLQWAHKWSRANQEQFSGICPA